MKKPLRHLTFATTLSLALVACGGTGTPNQPTVTSQTITGTLTALSSDGSSMTVAGKTLKLSSTTMAAASLRPQATSSVTVNGKAAATSALSVGQQVTVKATNGQVTAVDIDIELKGQIELIDITANTITIAGQTVQVTADTRIDLDTDEDTATSTSSTIADLNQGLFVEVSGERDTSGAIVATKIEVKDALELEEDSQDDDTEFEGTLSALNSIDRTFLLEGITVSYATAKVEGVLVNGAEVEVEGTYDATTRTLVASEVEVEDDEDNGFTPGSSIVIEDEVESINLANKTFAIEDAVVNFAAAQVTGTLVVEAEVTITGTVDTRNAKLIHATQVTVETDD